MTSTARTTRELIERAEDWDRRLVALLEEMDGTFPDGTTRAIEDALRAAFIPSARVEWIVCEVHDRQFQARQMIRDAITAVGNIAPELQYAEKKAAGPVQLR